MSSLAIKEKRKTSRTTTHELEIIDQIVTVPHMGIPPVALLGPVETVGGFSWWLRAAPPVGCPSAPGLCLQNNVVGRLCNECAEGSFHLSTRNPDGCLKCFCMGVSRQCTSSSWSRAQVPLWGRRG